MKLTINLAVFLFQTVLRSWKSLMVLIIVPCIFLTGIGWVCIELLDEEAPNQLVEIALVDQDDTTETQYVIQQLLESDHLKKLTKIEEVDEEVALQLMEQNEVAAMIVIPEGFSRDVTRGKNTPVKVVGNTQRPLQSQLVFHLMESATKFVSAAQSGINTVFHFLEKEKVSKEDLRKEYKNSIVSYSLHVLGRGELFEVKEKQNLFQQNMLQYYCLSFYLLLLFIWSFGLILLLKEKLNQSIRNRLLSMGISSNIEKMAIFVTVAIMMTLMAYVASIPIFLWLNISIARVAVFLGILLVVASINSFFMFLDALVQNDKWYLLLGIVVILIGAIVGGHIIPSVYFPAWLENIGDFTLNFWSLQFILLIFQTDTVSLPLESIKVLGICLIVFLALALFLNKRGEKRRFG